MVNSKKIIRVFLLLFLAGCVVSGFAIYQRYERFNKMVMERFHGQLWELPARVYALPLALYPGMPMKTEILELALKHMQYRGVKTLKKLDSPGQYHRHGDLFTVFRKPYTLGKKFHGPLKIQVKMKRNTVLSIKDLPSQETREMIRLSPALIGSFYPKNNEDRVLLDLAHTPPLLCKTLIAVEDRSFNSHHGIDPLAILRAMLINLREGRASQGASTITQQLAKNYFLTPEKSFKRKLDEMFVAVAMERNFSKDDILETYLNEVYLGQDGNRAIHGFGLASTFYFGKHPDALKPHEIALLVGMLKGPSRYNPRKYPERALARRNRVLRILQDQGVLSKDVVQRAMSAPLDIIEDPMSTHSPFPAYLDLVKRQLLTEYRESDLRSAGMRIFTTLDLQVQLSAQRAADRELHSIESAHRIEPQTLETAVVVTATAGNEVLALLNGRKASARGFNRSLDARRAIGSLIKPAVFLTALSHPERYTLITPITDGPVNVPLPNGKSWRPENYDHRYHGTIPLYQALVHSYNASTVRLGMDLGLPAVSETLKELGFTRKVRMYPSSLLGTVEMAPLEVAQIYQTLASGGFYSPIRAIGSVFKSDGSILRRYPLSVKQNLGPGPVYLINKVLQTVVTEGTAASLKEMVPQSWGTAGKTGTTNELRDSWFAGFTGSKLAVVWVGRDDNRPCGLSGATGAMRLWGRLMEAVPNTPLLLTPPEDVKTVAVNIETGLQSSGANILSVPFIKGSEPSRKAQGLNKKKHESETDFIKWLKDLFK